MKRTLIAIICIALVAIVVMIFTARGLSTGSNELSVSEEDIQPTEALQPPTPEPEIDTASQPAPPATAREATVSRLADGDSFDIIWTDSGERDEVRLYGINAPEGDACFGQAARGVLEVLTDDETLMVDGVDRDEFGRVLADVWVGDLFVNATMVELGAALTISGDGNYADLIAERQEEAEALQVGLWDPAACGADPSVDIEIASIVFDAPGRDNENQNGEWIEIANQGDTAAEMTGWSIRDESTRHRYDFPDGFTLAAGAAVRVFSGCGTDDSESLFWCDEDPVWNNGGDTGFLVDADGRFADTYAYSG